jgi:hypothetical protein
MPNATLERLATSRPLVAAAAIDRSQVPGDFVGQLIAPDFQVDSFDFDYPVFGNEALEAEDDDAVGNKGEFKEVKISEGTDSGNVFEHGRKALISRQEMQASNNADRMARQSGRAGSAQFNLRVRYAAVLRQQVLRRREIIIAKLATTSGNYDGSHVSPTLNVRTDADLREKVRVMSQTIVDDTGFEPNTAIVGRGARFGMEVNAAIQDFMADNAPKFVTLDFLKQYLGLANVYFGGALSKKTSKSAATPIWDNVIWIGYVDPTANGGGGTWARNFWMPYEGGGRADTQEIVVGNERNTWLSYAEMYNPVIVGADFAALIPTTSV